MEKISDKKCLLKIHLDYDKIYFATRECKLQLKEFYIFDSLVIHEDDTRHSTTKPFFFFFFYFQYLQTR